MFDETQAAIHLNCRLSSEEKEDAEISAVIRQLGVMYNCADVRMRHFGSLECAFFQTALGSYYPDIQDFIIKEGRLDADAIGYFEGYRLTDVKIDKILGNSLLFDFANKNLSLKIGHAHGDLAFNLIESEPLKTINAHFLLDDGVIHYNGINGNVWKLEQLHTALSILDGVLQKSEIHGQSAGFQGAIDVDWGSKKEFLKMDFLGPAKNISAFMPLAFSQAIDRTFNEDQVNIIGSMVWRETGSSFNGELRFSGDNVQKGDKVIFGFDLEKSSEKLWRRWPADQLAVSYWSNVGLEAMQKIMPAVTLPMILFETNWIRAESGIGGLVVRKGWFSAKDLSLSKYLSPLLFRNQEISLNGRGSFKGVFDHKCVAIEYEAESVVFENGLWTLGVDKINALKKRSSSMSAAHYFDFEKGQHYGAIPLSGAQFFEKNSGVAFSNLDALVIVEGSELHFLNLSANCSNLELEGAIDVDFAVQDEGLFKMDIRLGVIKRKSRRS